MTRAESGAFWSWVFLPTPPIRGGLWDPATSLTRVVPGLILVGQLCHKADQKSQCIYGSATSPQRLCAMTSRDGLSRGIHSSLQAFRNKAEVKEASLHRGSAPGGFGSARAQGHMSQ